MNIPKLRFKDNNGNDYPQWNHSSFYNTFNFLSTNNYSRNDMNSINGNIRNIHYGDILTKFNYIINTEKDILPYLNDNIIIKNLPNYIIQSGDIVIADTAEDYTTGKTCEIINSNNQLVVAGLHTMLCRPKQNIFALGFLGYFMNSNIYHNQLLPLITGIKVYSIIKKEIIKTKISIPFIEEQKKIAKFLTTVDKKITNLENTITSLENQKKGLLQQIFSQKLRFKDKNGNNYPNWEKKKLGDICTIIGGGTPDSSNDEYWNGNINWFTPSEIGKTKFISESIRKITEKGLKNSSAKLLPKGTILLSSRATIGEKSILLSSATTNQGFQSLVINKLAFNEFIFYYLDILKNSMIKYSSGSTFLEISKTQIKNINIILPCLEEQTKIADFLSAFDRKLNNQKAQLEHWQQIKKGLLQQMFV